MERHPAPFSASQKEARQKSQKGRKRSEPGLKAKVKKFAMRRRRPRGQGCEGGECFSINFASFQTGTFWIADAPEMTETIFGKAVFGMAGTDGHNLMNLIVISMVAIISHQGHADPQVRSVKSSE